MEFLEKIGDFLNVFFSSLERMIRRFFGSSNERMIKQIGFVRDKEGNDSIVPGSIVDRINQLEGDFEKLSEGELAGQTEKFRARLKDGESLDDMLPEAFAAVRESSKRHLKMRHYDVQLVGGCILHRGMIAEMVTGEGKTLVGTLPAYLNAIAGKVHLVTVNDYLAKRDMEWMGPVHLGLGLSVGAIQSQMPPSQRQIAYGSDITYGTSNEFGFDYLRDNMKPTKELQVQGPLDYAIVDEIDNILIDEARTPLIISGPASDDITQYSKAHRIAIKLKKDEHFEVKEKEHTCHLTDAGVRKAEELAEVDSFYTAGNMHWPHLIDNSLKALHLYKRDVHYVVENGEIVIVDDNTGRKMYGRQWSDGLHQSVEAKEGVRIKETTQTLATITLQNYFRLYKKLAGMTGTAMTEASEFWKIYQLDVVAVPTNRPSRRVNHPDAIFRSENEKWNAVADEIEREHKKGRPVLVGTVSIEKSEILSNKLIKRGIKPAVLNAKFHEKEAEIVSQAGRLGAVTVSTNMAGRGTDIVLGGNPEYLAWEELQQKYESRLDVPKSVWDETSRMIAKREGMDDEAEKVRDVGGLYVLGTERHDARRIDLQLRGRAGRQGDPGESRFFVSMEDPLMRLFAGDFVKGMLGRLGMQDGEAIESPMVTRQLEKAQKRREEFHFDQRKNLLEYDEVMDEQRKRVYSYRQRILDGGNCRELILEMIDQQVEERVAEFLSEKYRWEVISEVVGRQFGIDVDEHEIRGMEKDQLTDYLLEAAERQAEDLLSEQIEESFPESVENQEGWNWLSFSRWVNQKYGLNTNDRELKKIGRDELVPELMSRIKKSIDKYDFGPLDQFLQDDFGPKTVSAWLSQQYGIEAAPTEFEKLEPDDAVELVRGKLRDQYRDKEIQFPVTVGLSRFAGSGRNSNEMDRNGLVRWAQNRFDAKLPEEELEKRSKNDLLKELSEQSEKYFERSRFIEEMEPVIRLAYGSPHNGEQTNGQHSNGHAAGNGQGLPKLVQWANEHFKTELSVREFEELDSDWAKQRLLQEFDKRYRPEFSQAERSLILSVLDSAWKEHLHFMDHLRSGIGLVGYAQKDPKVEYKREGMKAFEQMWSRVADQVTGSIFRIETFDPDWVGSLWEITATTHDTPDEAVPVEQQAHQPAAEQYQTNSPEPGAGSQAVEPIRNESQKVGRNDPCPCGSGKKYKKCCGAR